MGIFSKLFNNKNDKEIEKHLAPPTPEEIRELDRLERLEALEKRKQAIYSEKDSSKNKDQVISAIGKSQRTSESRSESETKYFNAQPLLNNSFEPGNRWQPLASPFGSSVNDRDAYFAEAGKLIIDKDKASIGMLQRMFKIPFNRAARLMDQLADAGVVGPEEGTKPRKVIMTAEQFEHHLEEEDFPHLLKRDPGSTNPALKNTLPEEPISEEELISTINEKLHKEVSFSDRSIEIIKDVGNVLVPKTNYDDPFVLLDEIFTRCSPSKVKLVIIDEAGILDLYSSLPNLFLPVIKEKKKVEGALNWLSAELSSRTKTCTEYGVRDINAYNDKIEELQNLEGDKKPPFMANVVVFFREIRDISEDINLCSILESILPYCNRFGISVIAFSMYERKHLSLGRLDSFLTVRSPGWIRHLFDEEHEPKRVHDLESIDKMSGIEFEEFCSNLLRDNGFSNVSVTKASGDYGGDILAEKDRIKYVIQCKRYESSIGLHAVQEVIASRSIYKTHVGGVMTNSFYTTQAKTLADNNNIILWDRNDLIRMLKNQTN